jgi:hypothetical protein
MVQGNDWDEWLPMYAFAYNTIPSPYHLYTPFELLFGNKANLPEEMFTQIEPLYNPENYSEVTKFKLKIALQKAQQMIDEEKEKRKDEVLFSRLSLVKERNSVFPRLRKE